ncbi:unnamed protein product [Rotaria magnacalcarata]
MVQRNLKRLHSIHVSRLRNTLKNVKHIALTAYFWSDRHQNSFFFITGHYIEDMVSKTTILHFQSYDKRHSSSQIASEVYNCLRELGIEQKVTSVTCDGAQNMKNAFDMFDGADRLWCVAHRLHLTICNGLALWKKFNKAEDNSNTNGIDSDESIDVKTSLDEYDTEMVQDGSENEKMDRAIDDYDDEDEENQDLITDSWGDSIATGDIANMDIDEGDNEQDTPITKENLAKTIHKGRQLIKTIRRSQILTMFINNEKKGLKITCHLIMDCITRWNSTYLAIKSLQEHKTVMLNLFENKGKLPIPTKQKEKLTLLEISSDDWTLINNLIYLLKPFYEATSLLSGTKYPTIGLRLFAIQNIKEYLEKEDDDQSEILTTLKKFVLQSLNEYFDENDPQYKLLVLYGYFEPLGYSILSTAEKTKIERGIKQKSKELSKAPNSNTVASASSISSAHISQSATPKSNINTQNNNNNKRLASFLKSIDKYVPNERASTKKISEEISLYGSLCRSNSSIDALTFWKVNGDQMPLLKEMAQVYLSTPGTSVPSESAFSTSAYIGRKERARLSPENLSYTVFLKDKLLSSIN